MGEQWSRFRLFTESYIGGVLMLAAFGISCGMIFLAELGDKSQLICLTLSARYRWTIVLLGITIATGCNHLLSVAIGGGLESLLPMFYVKLMAGLAFFIFGAWTLRGDTVDDDEVKTVSRGILWTIALTFFLAELGDKTMLATITLATTYSQFWVWVGSTLGMVLSDALALIIGAVLGKNLPERFVKISAAVIFFAYGAFLVGETLWLGA
jgi:putative Ca2+/H+ antiporter (TMEM165/GDT1 family)